ncbi:glyoxalase bleomycin resistance dioxygenase [Fusarium sporotrichioides]|jgi:catechol 2,3-dioxygenase-like lactoylglutathione lyase family enzyme|uniref:Glyoxalase bleomycin resistance dioxygenase n=1 Tax=Fusarium sporotrichioides TaxID=5514 RepID=A0A395RXF0_FUSSP|nr:glyoxalase bleomycin resistance dioxygenase [Fusarium sporotrichioides]
MGLSHFALPCGEHYVEMRDFYKAVLAPLGYEFKFEAQGPSGAYYCAFGEKNKGPDFWLGGGGGSLKKYDGNMENRTCPVHFAFDAENQKHVDEWHENAMKAGAVDNGKPGLREYRPGYYAAFVLDPVGNNVEVLHLG